MKTGAMSVLLFSLSFLSVFSTANAADFFPHGFDGRAREIRFDRGERFGGERFGGERFAHERAARESFGREHEVRAARAREDRGWHATGRAIGVKR
jgi:hypothetical protein